VAFENPVPPQAVQQVAEGALEDRAKHRRGGTAVGVARARDLANGKGISLATLKRMRSFFARHEGDPRDDKTSAASIAWRLWGGSVGQKWVEGQLGKHERAMLAAKRKK
jgi:hypothetical protein